MRRVFHRSSRSPSDSSFRNGPLQFSPIFNNGAHAAQSVGKRRNAPVFASAPYAKSKPPVHSAAKNSRQQLSSYHSFERYNIAFNFIDPYTVLCSYREQIVIFPEIISASIGNKPKICVTQKKYFCDQKKSVI